MNSDNAICKIFELAFQKSDLLHDYPEVFLIVESLNTLYQILIGVLVACDDISDFRYYVEGVLFVELSEKRVLDFAELQAHESSSIFQDSVSFLQGLFGSRNVSQTKRNCIGVKLFVL